MFVLVEMKDVLHIKPERYNDVIENAITSELNKKFANKVIHNVGLCVTLFDLLEIGDSHLLTGRGGHYTRVTFRFVVFRPFIDEIIFGKISSSNKDGIKVSLGFFDDILIPASCLQSNSKYEERSSMWVWQVEAEDEIHNLYMEEGDKIKFRVISEKFVESPIPEKSDDPSKEIVAPYTIIGAIVESGLGVTEWWEGR